MKIQQSYVGSDDADSREQSARNNNVALIKSAFIINMNSKIIYIEGNAFV